MIRLLIVDDHAVVRHGLRTMLGGVLGLLVAGEAADGAQAIEAAERLRPDLILLDLKMPGMSGAAACRAIKQGLPATKVIMLTGVEAEAEVMAALESGADGYVLKDAAPEELIRAIEIVHGGQAYLQPSVTRRVLRRLYHNAAPQAALAPPQLTQRELEVLRLMATSRSNKEMAEAIHVTEETVRSHIKSILAKLQQPNRMQAVLAAMRMGLIPLE